MKSCSIAFFIFLNLCINASSFGSSSGSSSYRIGEKEFNENQRKELLSKNVTRMIVILEHLYKNETDCSTLKFLFRLLVHPKLSSKKLYHASAILELDYFTNVLVEYGNYKDEETNSFSSFIPSSGSFVKNDKNNFTNKYHYLNYNNGLRFIKLESREYIYKYIHNALHMNSVLCNVLVNRTLGNVLDKFKNGWASKDYIIGVHDCQKFVVELIYELKAVRIPGLDRLRTTEKFQLTNDMMNAFAENERDLNNTIGRIPIIGLAYDISIYCKYSIEYMKKSVIYNKTKEYFNYYFSGFKQSLSKHNYFLY